jgi:hypothetical protein
MTDFKADLFVDVNPAKAIGMWSLDGNYFLIASMIGLYSLWQRLHSGQADGSSNCHRNASTVQPSFPFHTALQVICPEPHANRM